MVDNSISPLSLNKCCVKDPNDTKITEDSIIPVMVTSQLCVIGNSKIDVPLPTSNGNENENRLRNGRSYRKHKRHRRNRKAGKHHQKISKSKRHLSMNIRRAIVRHPTDLCRSRNGRPMAPYNTTQFIMEQNNKDAGSPRIRSLSDEPDWLSSAESSSECDSLCCDCHSDSQLDNIIDEEMEKDFIKIYDDVNAERLLCMSKEDLVKECIELEAKNTHLERALMSSRRSSSP